MNTRLILVILLGTLLLTACSRTPPPPDVTITNPADKTVVNEPSVTVEGTVANAASLRYTINAGAAQQLEIQNGTFSFTVTDLNEGTNTVRVTAEDARGRTDSATVRVIYEIIDITHPQDGASVDRGSVMLAGTVAPVVTELSYTVNDSAPVPLEFEGTEFSTEVRGLVRGENVITVTATTEGGTTAAEQVTVIWPTEPKEVPIENAARIRFLHGSPDTAPVSVLANGDVILDAVPYKTGTPYFEIAPGEYTLLVRATRAGTTLIDGSNGLGTMTLEPNTYYTIIILGEAGARHALVLDDPALPQQNQVELQVMHASPAAAAVTSQLDVFVTEPGAPLTDPVSLAYGEIAPVPGLTAGVYQVRITPTGDASTVLYDSGAVEIHSGMNLNFTILDSNIEVDGASILTLVRLTGLEEPGALELADVTLCEAYAPNHAFADAETILPGGALSAALCLEEVDVGGVIIEEYLPDIYRFQLAEPRVVFVDIAAHELGSDLNSILALYEYDATSNEETLLDFNYNAGPGTKDSTLGIELPAGEYFVAVEHTGYADVTALPYELHLTTEDPAATVYEAAAGTFRGASNSAVVGSFSGNVLLMSVRSGNQRGVKTLVNITVPNVGTFPFAFDPAFAVGGVIAVAIEDFSPTAQTLVSPSQRLEALRQGELEPQAFTSGTPGILRYRPSGMLLPQAAVGGDFVFAFPTKTVTVTVDASQVIAPPQVTNVTTSGSAVQVAFEETATLYKVHAYGRTSGVGGSIVVSESPATVPLNGSLQAGEPIGATVLAGHTLYEAPLPSGEQVNLSEFLFLE